jgi:hypothetical protein
MSDDINPSQLLIEIANSLLWVRSDSAEGHDRGPMVDQFEKCLGGTVLGESYCMFFVQYCVKQVEARLGIQSNIFRSGYCMAVWNSSPVLMRRPAPPAAGQIVIWNRRGTTQGHTGIVTGMRSPAVFTTIEGNTSPGMGIEAEGLGVYAKERTLSGNAMFELKGFLQPF